MHVRRSGEHKPEQFVDDVLMAFDDTGTRTGAKSPQVVRSTFVGAEGHPEILGGRAQVCQSVIGFGLRAAAGSRQPAAGGRRPAAGEQDHHDTDGFQPPTPEREGLAGNLIDDLPTHIVRA